VAKTTFAVEACEVLHTEMIVTLRVHGLAIYELRLKRLPQNLLSFICSSTLKKFSSMHFHTILSVLVALFVIGGSASPAPLTNETDVRFVYD
jgi:hypothetical protein